MNKGRRNELRNLRWTRRLNTLGLKRIKERDFICYRDQGKPCSCAMCSPGLVGDKEKYIVKNRKEKY